MAAKSESRERLVGASPRAGLCDYLIELGDHLWLCPTSEYVAEAQKQFGSGNCSASDVYAALHRLMQRGRFIQLKSSTESRWALVYPEDKRSPAECLERYAKVIEKWLCYQDETEELWRDLDAALRLRR